MLSGITTLREIVGVLVSKNITPFSKAVSLPGIIRGIFLNKLISFQCGHGLYPCVVPSDVSVGPQSEASEKDWINVRNGSWSLVSTRLADLLRTS